MTSSLFSLEDIPEVPSLSSSPDYGLYLPPSPAFLPRSMTNISSSSSINTYHHQKTKRNLSHPSSMTIKTEDSMLTLMDQEGQPFCLLNYILNTTLEILHARIIKVIKLYDLSLKKVARDCNLPVHILTLFLEHHSSTFSSSTIDKENLLDSLRRVLWFYDLSLVMEVVRFCNTYQIEYDTLLMKFLTYEIRITNPASPSSLPLLVSTDEKIMIFPKWFQMNLVFSQREIVDSFLLQCLCTPGTESSTSASPIEPIYFKHVFKKPRFYQKHMSFSSQSIQEAANSAKEYDEQQHSNHNHNHNPNPLIFSCRQENTLQLHLVSFQVGKKEFNDIPIHLP